MADMTTPLDRLLTVAEAQAATTIVNVSHVGNPFSDCTMQNTERGTRVYLDARCTVDVTDAFNAWAAEHAQPRDPETLALVQRIREQLTADNVDAVCTVRGWSPADIRAVLAAFEIPVTE